MEMGPIGEYLTDVDRMTEFHGHVLGFTVTDDESFRPVEDSRNDAKTRVV